ncbi:hypothetical protein GP486_005943 [Trichoglossum hirsutum]|uniref:ribonuclease H n=1 Tax=Trichoglossum hirsutum TaxID=265104 RepID=A0A9P8RLP3_9PEZI|nr:hypothetical protein GP486_005943 [Trichoglossum hirsutum]
MPSSSSSSSGGVPTVDQPSSQPFRQRNPLTLTKRLLCWSLVVGRALRFGPRDKLGRQDFKTDPAHSATPISSMGVDWHPSSADPSDRHQKRILVDDDRKYDPCYLFGDDVDLDEVEVPRGDWVHEACHNGDLCKYCRRYPAHTDAIIIAVDGACRNNGKTDASAAVGVFVGDGSEYNLGSVLNMVEPTSQKAELKAAILGLRAAQVILGRGIAGGELGKVIIKADSEYMVKGMTDWIYKWNANGYMTARGKPVANAGLFQMLERLVLRLNGRNVKVQFWHVPREHNKDADELANAALDEN